MKVLLYCKDCSGRWRLETGSRNRIKTFGQKWIYLGLSSDPVSLRCKEKVLQKIGSQFVKWPRLQFLSETLFGSFLVEKPPKTSVSIFVCYLTFCNKYYQQIIYTAKDLCSKESVRSPIKCPFVIVCHYFFSLSIFYSSNPSRFY